MKDNTVKWLNKLTLLKTFIGGGIFVFLVGGLIYGTHRSTAQGSCRVRHGFIVKILKENLRSDEQVPTTLSELSHIDKILLPAISFEKKNHDLKYYPDAWGKPGRIFLRSSVLGSYIVTFGDGSMAILISWHYRPRPLGEQTDTISLSENERDFRAKDFLGTFPVVVLIISLLTAFVVVTITEQIMKKKLKHITNKE